MPFAGENILCREHEHGMNMPQYHETFLPEVMVVANDTIFDLCLTIFLVNISSQLMLSFELDIISTDIITLLSSCIHSLIL